MPTPRGSGYRQPGNWATLKRHILNRDGHTCYACKGTAVTVDHLIPVARGGTHHPSNLAAICIPCHDEKTKREAASARISPVRPIGRHPGLL